MSTTSRASSIEIDERVHAGQQAILESPARFRMVACGRRWGKTVTCAKETRDDLLEHGEGWLTWWTAPTYQQAEIGMRAVLEELPDDVVADVNRSKLRVEVVTGAIVEFKSADQPDNLRGEGVDKLVIDEAPEVSQYAWEHALRPTLTDSEHSRMIAIGTPKGRGWFYRLWERGNSPDWEEYESFQAPTAQNPFINADDVAEARQTIPDRVFRQEYLAEFIDDAGGVFPKLDECGVLVEYEWAELEGTPPYALGVDFARHQDWTVLIAIDAAGRLVHFERVQGESWPQIQRRVEQAAGRYPGVCIVDASRDNKIVSDLAETGLHVVPEQFSPKRKRELIENLVTRLEAAEIELPPIEQLVHELQLFEYEVTAAGNVRYNAPEGFHDDCVDALALAASKLDAIAPYAGRDVEEELAERDTGVSHL